MDPPTRIHGKTPSRQRTARPSAKITPAQLAAIEKELKTLPDLIRTHYTKWTTGASDFQLDCMNAQKLGIDVILHAATGSGKTGIAAGPHLLPSSKGKVTIMVSPLLSLHDEQVATFQNEFGLKATAINSSNGGCTKAIMEKVVAGEWQIVMLSPEMLLSRRFIDGVLRKSAFGARCLSVFIDEAHCISHWGASFRKKYASIGIIRAFLPRATPIIAVTATLTPRVHQDLITKLQFDPNNYQFSSIGNDRPKVSQIIRSMQHPANSYRDIDFMVREGAEPKDIQKAFLYSDDIKDGGKIIDRLNSRVSPAYRNRGLVRPYSAAMSREYRQHVMALFNAGIVRILVCTDAAGMGCDIPDVDLVVQWKAPPNLSSWIQRAGRAARAAGRVGIAVMIVEKSAFEVAPLASGNADATTTAPAAASATRGRGRGRGRGGRGGAGRRGGKKQGKEYAELHGQKRGWFKSTNDIMEALEDAVVEMPADAPAEGLYVLIQATICRRRILAQIFKNDVSTAEKVTCCDICNPQLFDTVRPSKPVRATRQKGIRKVPPVDSVRQSLFSWRRNIKKMHYPYAVFAANAILDDATCELLASIGPIDAIEPLEQLLKSSWSRWEELGNRLFVYMKSLDIPSLPPAPTRGRKPAAQPAPNAPSQSPLPQSVQPTPTQHSNRTPASTSRSSPDSSVPTKRKQPHHSARSADSLPAGRRARFESPPPTPQAPAVSRPKPIPAYRGFPPPETRSRSGYHPPLPASNYQTPHRQSTASSPFSPQTPSFPHPFGPPTHNVYGQPPPTSSSSYYHPPTHPSPFGPPAYPPVPSFSSFPSPQNTPYTPQQAYTSSPYGTTYNYGLPYHPPPAFFPGPNSSPMPPNFSSYAYSNNPSPSVIPPVYMTPQSQGVSQTTESPPPAPPPAQPHTEPDWDTESENFYY
ncbi:P-loop containing nucleoside triphosphate hydrolase protein [Mycena crocata]|nr:P-loop containing nucleoside triphosphate hydrolase protein [Mycena crocata]